jgi:hypothetical protein
MKTYLHKLLLMTVAIGLSGSSLVLADFRDNADHKAWTNFGRWTSPTANSRSYRENVPMVVRNESAPAAMAQAPSQERTYSYEPPQQAAGSTGCVKGDASTQSPNTAQQPSGNTRSFSYEPANSVPASARSYNAPRGEFSIDVARHAKGY